LKSRFTGVFKARRDALTVAGLPAGLSPHGLRKAACRRLAEAGCTPHQIMAVSGHKNLQEVVTYTEAANRARLAGEALGASRMPSRRSNTEQKLSNRRYRFDNSAGKPSRIRREK